MPSFSKSENEGQTTLNNVREVPTLCLVHWVCKKFLLRIALFSPRQVARPSVHALFAEIPPKKTHIRKDQKDSCSSSRHSPRILTPRDSPSSLFPFPESVTLFFHELGPSEEEKKSSFFSAPWQRREREEENLNSKEVVFCFQKKSCCCFLQAVRQASRPSFFLAILPSSPPVIPSLGPPRQACTLASSFLRLAAMFRNRKERDNGDP